jgi:hypothetical protein
MIKRKVFKLDLAREYLDTALKFFLGRTNFFCAIHLAAAAEELFGEHLPKSQRIATLAWKAQKALMSETGRVPPDKVAKAARKSVFQWKNEIKHMRNRRRRTIRIDPEFVAEHYIERALVNFDKLKLRKSAAIRKFEDHQARKSARLERVIE